MDTPKEKRGPSAQHRGHGLSNELVEPGVGAVAVASRIYASGPSLSPPSEPYALALCLGSMPQPCDSVRSVIHLSPKE